MQDLHQVANALLPDIQCMLPGGARHYVFPIPRETTFFPWGPKRQEHPQEKLEPEPREGHSPPLLVTIPTYSPSPAVSA